MTNKYQKTVIPSPAVSKSLFFKRCCYCYFFFFFLYLLFLLLLIFGTFRFLFLSPLCVCCRKVQLKCGRISFWHIAPATTVNQPNKQATDEAQPTVATIHYAFVWHVCLCHKFEGRLSSTLVFQTTFADLCFLFSLLLFYFRFLLFFFLRTFYFGATQLFTFSVVCISLVCLHALPTCLP